MNTCKYTSNSCTLSKADSILYGRNVDIQYLNDNTYLAQRLDTFDFTTCKISRTASQRGAFVKKIKNDEN